MTGPSRLSSDAASRAVRLLRERSRWLRLRVDRYARHDGLAAQEPLWSPVMAMMTDALAGELTGEPDAGMTEAMAREVLHQRARGRSLDRFIGRLKCLCRACDDLVTHAAAAERDRLALVRYVRRFFDRTELSAIAVWCNTAQSEETAELRRLLEDLTHGRDLYAAVFENARMPLFIACGEIDVNPINQCARHLIDEVNEAGCIIEFRQLVDSDIPEARFLGRTFMLRRLAFGDARRGTEERVIVLQDVTSERAAQRQEKNLKDIQSQVSELQAIATLAGGMAHEMNNMLQPIIGMTSIVLRGLPAGHRDAEALEVVLEAADRARDLVSRIEKFSRRDRGRAEVVSPAEEMQRAIDSLRASLPQGVDLVCDIAPALPDVAIERGMLEQCLLNLGYNSIQAMDGRRGTVHFRLGRLARDDHDFGAALSGMLGSGVVFTVEDDGAGMSAEVLEHCLEPFFTTKPVGIGTGLGLAVVHGMMNAAGGLITVASVPGAGTTIRGVLPAIEQRPSRPRAEEVDERR